MSATILGGAVLQRPIGHLSDFIDRRLMLVLTGSVTAVVAAIAGFIVIEGRPGLVLSACLYGGLMFSLYGISVAHTSDHLQHGQVLEATRGLLLTFGLGAVCGPLLVGLAMKAAGPVGLPAVSALTAVALALFGIYRMLRRAPPPRAAQSEFVPLVRTSPVALEMYPEADVAPELELPKREH